jgi:hypothetical protein
VPYRSITFSMMLPLCCFSAPWAVALKAATPWPMPESQDD